MARSSHEMAKLRALLRTSNLLLNVNDLPARLILGLRMSELLIRRLTKTKFEHRLINQKMSQN